MAYAGLTRIAPLAAVCRTHTPTLIDAATFDTHDASIGDTCTRVSSLVHQHMTYSCKLNELC